MSRPTSANDNSEPLFYYTQQSILYGLAGGYLASLAFDRGGRGDRRALALWAASGFALGLAVLTKHTIGAGAALPVLVHALLVRRRLAPRPEARGRSPEDPPPPPGHPLARLDLVAGVAERVGPAGLVVLGAALPGLAVAVWLASAGALGAALRQVLIEAPEAKGPVLGTFTRCFTVAGSGGIFTTAEIAGLALLAGLAGLRGARRWARGPTAPMVRSMVAAALASLVALGVGMATAQGWPHPRLPQLAASALGLWGSLGLAVAYGVGLAQRRDDPERWQASLFASTSFWLAYALSLSWGLYEQMALPALACVLCAFGDIPREEEREPLESACVVGLAVVVTATGAACKRIVPYDWSLWREPPLWEARALSAAPELRGMDVSASTARIVDGLTSDIAAASSADDRVFVYPYLPLLYELAHRRPATFARVHWFDVTPDDVARADAQRLLGDPPAVIVAVRFGEAFYRGHEHLFRGDRPSGQRAIEAALTELAPRYDVIDEVRLPFSKVPVVVWKLRR